VITPRRTTLFRAADLASFRTTLADRIVALSPEQARDTFVVVPTSAAAEQLRRTIENRALSASRRALVWPILGTRHALYVELAARLPRPPALLSVFDREVILSAAARQVADEGLSPPFRVRPRLLAEMLAFYDYIRRLGRTVDDFERNFCDELEREQDHDRGAARLLQQTRFLAAAYRAYDARVAETERLDEHVLRASLLACTSTRPLQHVIVTVGDWLVDPDGLWTADFDLLTRVPELRHVDLVNTEGVLATGLLERLYGFLPELEEERSNGSPGSRPVLVTPGRGTQDGPPPIAYAYRDREEELIAVARRLKAERATETGSSLERTGLIVQRPLPYLYLARDVFADAAIPFETLDTLPLAAEPYAAALDLVLDAVATDFARSALLALLRSPHFRLQARATGIEGVASLGVTPDETVSALDFSLAEARYLGGLDRLHSLVEQWSHIVVPSSREERRYQRALPAGHAVLDAAVALRPLCSERPITEQLATLIEWLRRFDRPALDDDPVGSRRLRVRAAVLGTLAGLADACQGYDPDAPADIAALAATIRRWLGSQTFAVQSGESGLQIVDARAARYGAFDDLQIVGLIEGEWPERTRRNVFYPASLLASLEPAVSAEPNRRDRDALRSARAAFRDLVMSPTTRIRLSTFALESDAVVEPSVLLDEVPGFGLEQEQRAPPSTRVSYAEAIALEPRLPDVLPEAACAWALARLSDDSVAAARFKGDAGPWILPRVSVSRLERYLDCPFRFFASEVLRLEEQPEDEDTRTPLERGRFLHELWEQFFAEWQKRGHGRVDPASLPEARALFEQLCEHALSQLSPWEAALERSRLLGSAVSPGIAHRVFAMEADRRVRIVERLLEFPLEGDFTFRGRDGTTRTITLSAKADRIDLLEDGTLRVIDYKSKKTPDVKQALQLPLYSFCARESLRRTRGGTWTLAEALYLSFESDKAVVPLRARGTTIDELIDDAQDRLLTTLDRIAEGHFPPRPAVKSLCKPCPYRTVCRLEIVEETEAGRD